MTTHKVLFHLVNGSSIEGLLASNLADGPVLKGAVMRLPENDAVPMAGDIWIPRAQILIAQFIDS